MENIYLGAGLIAIVGEVKRQYPQVTGVYAFLLACVLGAVAGYFGLFGATLETGLLTAVASSGFYKVVKK